MGSRRVLRWTLLLGIRWDIQENNKTRDDNKGFTEEYNIELSGQFEKYYLNCDIIRQWQTKMKLTSM